MLYHVSRNGQVYGPYTLEDLERYLVNGNVLPTDLARAEGTSEWLPVSQVLRGSAAASETARPRGAGTAGWGVPAAYSGGVSLYPDPPNLHWGLVLLFGIMTCGLFIVVWDIVQAVWMRKVNSRSNALFLYVAGDLVNVAGSMGVNMAFGGLNSTLGLVGLLTLVLVEMARFDMRRSLEEHFNGPEPVGLSLGPFMTAFFGSVYFQYHMNRINDLKRMVRYRAGVL